MLKLDVWFFDLEARDLLGVGFYEIAIPRFLLETCKNVEDAKITLMKSPQFYGGLPCHYLIGDASGWAFVWEFSKYRNQAYIHDCDGSPVCVTNHQLLDQEYAATEIIM